MKTRMILAITLIAACGVVILFAQQRPAGPYTADQATAGGTAYQNNCSSCHAANLAGRAGPQLAGANFMTQWGDRTVADLVSFMRSTMPPGGANLPDQTYVDIAAFILDSNGARAGTGNLSADSTVTIRSVALAQA